MAFQVEVIERATGAVVQTEEFVHQYAAADFAHNSKTKGRWRIYRVRLTELRTDRPLAEARLLGGAL